MARGLPFELRIRCQGGEPARYTVRFATMSGRGLVSLSADSLVREAELRTNGFSADLDLEQVLGGEFVFVGDGPGQDAKYRLWAGTRAELEELPPSGRWVEVPPVPVADQPFFVLDTDVMEGPGEGLRRLPEELATMPDDIISLESTSPDPAGSPSPLASLHDVPSLPDGGHLAWEASPDSEWGEEEVLAAPEGDEAAAVEVAPPRLEPEAETTLQAVRYLRGELRRERERRAELEALVARLRSGGGS